MSPGCPMEYWAHCVKPSCRKEPRPFIKPLLLSLDRRGARSARDVTWQIVLPTSSTDFRTRYLPETDSGDYEQPPDASLHPFCQHGTIMTCVKSALLLSFCRNDTLWGTFVANSVVAKSHGVYQNRCHLSALIVPRGLRSSASSPSSIVECRRHITNEPSLPCRRDPEASSKQLRSALVATAYGMFCSARTYDSSFQEGFG